MNIHRVAVDILRRGVEPPRHPQQCPPVPAAEPLFALNFAEAPIPDSWRRGHLVVFTCAGGCVGQIKSDGTTALRTTCDAHRPVGATTAWTCRCGAVGNPAGMACAQCGEAA